MNKYNIVYYFYQDLFNLDYYPYDYFLERVPILSINKDQELIKNKNIFFIKI